MNVSKYQVGKFEKLPQAFSNLLCIWSTSILFNKPEFNFGHDAIDSLLLCKGLTMSESHILLWSMSVSNMTCILYQKNKNALARLPKFATLYLGKLPDQFDLHLHLPLLPSHTCKVLITDSTNKTVTATR